jgi:hypothetical protein
MEVWKMPDNNRKLIEALDRIRELLASSQAGDALPGSDELTAHGDHGITFNNFVYPDIANGPVEQVLAFNNDEHIALKNLPDDLENLSPKDLKDLDPEDWPYFSSHGPLTDLHGHVLRGSRVETTFPVDPAKLAEAEQWPPHQPPPFDQPPVKDDHTKGHGYSKQAYFFDDENSFVTVGPSLPKIARLKGGGAQFWVGSIGVIAQGTGKYKGARGVTTYVGSGYLKEWPDSFVEQARVLAKGFKALVGTYVKVVLKEHLATPASSPKGRASTKEQEE